MLIAVKTPACPVCDEWSSVIVDHDDLAEWRNGMVIQRAMPYLNDDSRELLMTGTHPECWDRMFAPPTNRVVCKNTIDWFDEYA